MNFTILFIFTAIMFGLLWLSAKFLGKTGLIAFVLTSYVLSLFMALNTSLLGGVVSAGTPMFIAGVFGLYLIYKKYGIAETLKTLAVVFTFVIVYALCIFFINMYYSVPFFKSLEMGFVAQLIALLAMAVAFGIAYWLFETKLFSKFNNNFRAYLIIVLSLVGYCFISVMLGQIGDFGFGIMLLNFVLELLFSVIILGIFFLLEKTLTINDNEKLGEHLQKTLKETIEKTKKSIKKEDEDEKSETKTKKDEDVEEVVEEKEDDAKEE